MTTIKGMAFLSSAAIAAVAAAAINVPSQSTETTTKQDGITVVSAPASALPTPVPASVSAPAPDAAAGVVAPVRLAPLPPLDFSDMWLWNWSGKWHASEWGNGMSPIGWKFDHVQKQSTGDTVFALNAAGAPELQAMGGTQVYTRGLWEAEVTLPKLKDGLVVAPLWLWDSNSSDEVDFEFVGRKGLDVTLHAPVNGMMQQNTVRLFAGRDMSGERHRFGIKSDMQAGTVEMYMDGVRVHRWARGGMNFFISHPLKPMISMWAADPNNPWFVYWTGRWAGLAPGERLKMVVHGYKYTPLS